MLFLELVFFFQLFDMFFYLKNNDKSIYKKHLLFTINQSKRYWQPNFFLLSARVQQFLQGWWDDVDIGMKRHGYFWLVERHMSRISWVSNRWKLVRYSEQKSLSELIRISRTRGGFIEKVVSIEPNAHRLWRLFVSKRHYEKSSHIL